MELFDIAKDYFLLGNIDLEGAGPFKVLLKSGTPAPATAQNLDEIPFGERVGTPVALVNRDLLPNPSNTDELIFTADPVVIADAIGDTVTQVIIYLEGPSEDMSPLIMFSVATFECPVGVPLTVEWGAYLFKVGCLGLNNYFFSGKQLIYNGGIDFLADDIHVVLLKNSYIFDIAHTILSDIPNGDRVGNTLGYPIAGKVIGSPNDAGVFDGDDVVIPSLPVGDDIYAVALIKHDGTPNSQLIAYLAEGMNVPFTPNGGTSGVVWSDSPQRILKI
jgi:hypothetical protein